MGTRLVDNEHMRTTDHSVEIEALRNYTKAIMAAYPKNCPQDIRIKATVCEAAAALLECHDATGISLDDWTGPFELVLEGLWLIGKGEEDFVPNGV